MYNVTIICVGKLKEQYLRDACSEYQKRLTRFCKINIVEISESKLSDNPSEAEIEAALAKECSEISSKISSGARVITMCIEGEKLSSVKFAEKIDGFAVSGSGNLCFIIGSSFGIADELKNKSDFKMSMSDMTFPHQLARVMLLEQIYRAFMINNNCKYHKKYVW